jgi:hypothetical protein
MPKFLIEVPHSEETIACAKVVKVFLASGSHFLTHAYWGCADGVHKAWMVVDVDSRAEALGILPPAFRADAKVIGLNFFSMERIDAILAQHPAARR